MKVKVKKWFTTNLAWKIASFLLAIPIWLILINIANPMATKTITVDVDILNDSVITDNSQIYSIVSGKTVNLEVTARKRDIGEISAEDFYAYADMKYYYGQDDQTKAAQIKWRLSGHQSVIDPDFVRVKSDDNVIFKLENIITKEFMVGINKEGELSEDVTLGNVVAAPAIVTVTGPESKLASVGSVRCEIDLGKINADTSAVNSHIKMYNSLGKVIEDDALTLSQREVAVSIEVLKTKTLNVIFEDVTGMAAFGYRYSGLESDRSSIKVIGRKAALAEVSSVVVPASILDITGAMTDVKKAIDISQYLPENVTPVEDDTIVNVVLMIEELQTRSFKLNTADIIKEGTNPDYEYKFANETFYVRLKGFSEDLAAISSDDIVAKISVSGMEPGTYTLSPTITVSQDFQLVEDVSVSLTIAKIQPSPTPEAKPEDDENTEETSSDYSEPEEESESTPGITPEPIPETPEMVEPTIEEPVTEPSTQENIPEEIPESIENSQDI